MSGKKSEQGHESVYGDEAILNSSHPEARQLYDLAIKVKELAPWGWMEETDVFGVEDPDTRELGFVSIMGSVGEYMAIALYLGAEGFYGFVDLQENATNPARVLEIPHVQIAFLDREDLEKADRDLIKHLGLKFRGANSWPKFRSYRPSYFPWFVTVSEARFLIYALSATLDFATRVRDEPNPIKPKGKIEKDGWLVLAAKRKGDVLVWEDQVRRIPRPNSKYIPGSVDAVLLDRLKLIKQTNLEIETDLLLAPAKIGAKNERPRVLYMLMLADQDSGFLFGVDAMTAEDSLGAMQEQLPSVVAKMLLQSDIVPTRLIVRSNMLRSLLRPFAQSLNIAISFSDELPSIDQAAEAVSMWMSPGN